MADSSPQAKIRLTVDWYKKGFPDEYKLFKNQTQVARDMTENDTGVIKGTSNRPIHEIPEVLFAQLVKVLDADEMKWFTTNDASRWFAKTFPEFSLVKKV